MIRLCRGGVVPCAMLAATLSMSSPVSATGIVTTDPTLPPTTGEYRTPADVHASYSGGAMVLETIRHFGFTGITRTPLPPDEIENFHSIVEGVVNIPSVPLTAPVTLTGPVSVVVRNYNPPVVGTFDTEILSMDLTGFVGPQPIMIRESPTLPSLGRTAITDLGGGLYHIDSFFDVFTELSLDGGQTWIPSDESARVELFPEPATLSLLVLSGLAMIGRSRR